MFHDAEPLLLVIGEDLGGADIDAHPAAATGLFMDQYFEHQQFLLITWEWRGRLTTISSGIVPRAWVAQERQGS
ncbi:hypothetical protein GURASL_31030 [Geotalea uraniireducens]|uniref:Uncharacterized protein n=1 Tax=Geotalea uraniireducens TaxID=351604 RepID=A0ABM8ENZ8_9BACT|nr:hypothetical protein GURASL_31030 [Geotalea uraniireducens]